MTFKPSKDLLLPLLYTLLFACLSLPTYQATCHALVLEGGGDKGAYEVGVLSGFINNTNNTEDFQYDVVTGISIGAINAMGIAQFPIGQEREAIDYMVGMWKNSTRKEVYRNWPGGLLEGLFFKSALFNNDAEIEYLNNSLFTIPNQRRVTVATTDFHTGKKITFSEKDWANDRQIAINAALYSSAVPFIFLPRTYENYTFVDGGWSGEALDVEDAVFRCREIVDNDEDIIIDVIFAQNVSFSNASESKFNSFQIYSRFEEIQSYASATRAFSYAVDSFPNVQFRYVMIASERLPNQDVPLDFKLKNIEFMINLGIKDAINALNEGAGVSAKRVYDMSVEYQDNLFFNGKN